MRLRTLALAPLLLLAAVPVDAVAPPPGREAAPAASATLLIAGDIASCASDGDRRTAALITERVGLVMTAGDNVYPKGSSAAYRDCYEPTWGAFRERTRPVPGNHDWMVAGAAGYFDYFGRRAGPDRRGWYAFDLGTWRVYALTSDCAMVGGCGAGSRQLTWLRADLAAHPHACVLAVWHAPRFSSGPHGDSTAVLPLLRALYRAGAEVVVNGHDHLYERFAPAKPDGTLDPASGIRQFIVGTGGGPLYASTSRPDAHSEVRDSSTKGVLQLTLGPSGYAWMFLPVTTGGFTDSGTGTCH